MDLLYTQAIFRGRGFSNPQSPHNARGFRNLQGRRYDLPIRRRSRPRRVSSASSPNHGSLQNGQGGDRWGIQRVLCYRCAEHLPRAAGKKSSLCRDVGSHRRLPKQLYRHPPIPPKLLMRWSYHLVALTRFVVRVPSCQGRPTGCHSPSRVWRCCRCDCSILRATLEWTLSCNPACQRIARADSGGDVEARRDAR